MRAGDFGSWSRDEFEALIYDLFTQIETLQKNLDAIGDAVSLRIGDDCSVEDFCRAIREYQLDSIRSDKQ
jgi:hypothetical protein